MARNDCERSDRQSVTFAKAYILLLVIHVHKHTHIDTHSCLYSLIDIAAFRI